MTTPYRIEYLIEGARLVAILDGGGGAVVEEGRRILVEEGRIYSESANCGMSGGGGVLNYYCSFSLVDSPDPDSMVAVGAQMVISGTLSSGGWIEVRGSGDLTYDEHGNSQGEFGEMPKIIVETRAPVYHEPDPSCNADDWVQRMMSINPKTPADFERAAVGRDLDDLTDDSK
jgi:hypothetical protein